MDYEVSGEALYRDCDGYRPSALASPSAFGEPSSQGASAVPPGRERLALFRVLAAVGKRLARLAFRPRAFGRCRRLKGAFPAPRRAEDPRQSKPGVALDAALRMPKELFEIAAVDDGEKLHPVHADMIANQRRALPTADRLGPRQ